MDAIRPDSEPQQVVPTPLIGRDEMNLAEFPIAMLTDRVPEGQKTLYFEDQHGRLTITGSDAYGLPTATDTDVIVALIYLTRIRNEFRDEKVYFSRYELIKLLGWTDDAWYYKRLDEAFNRWSGVLLVYDKCWWNNKIKRYTNAKMHIIANVELVDSDSRRNADSEGGRGSHPSHFTWDRKFIESCQADNLRKLDLEEYFSLKSAVAKRLYRFLGKRFYVQGDWTFDLNEIAFDRVGLSRNYTDAGKIKEKLQPAIEELEGIGFLRPLSREERYRRVDRGQWTIRLARQSPTLVSPPQADVPPGPSPLIAELTKRGVTDKTTVGLVADHPAERIEAKIDVFDWMVEKGDKRVAKSPAGYLVKSIADDYATPKGFVSADDRRKAEEARAESERRADEERRRAREEDAREKALQKAVAAYWEALTPGQQAEVQAFADDRADPADLAVEYGPLKRMGKRIRREAYLRELLAANADDVNVMPALLETAYP